MTLNNLLSPERCTAKVDLKDNLKDNLKDVKAKENRIAEIVVGGATIIILTIALIVDIISGTCFGLSLF